MGGGRHGGFGRGAQRVLLILESEKGETMREVVPTNLITISGEKVIIPASKRFYIIDINSLDKNTRIGLLSLALQTENPWEFS